jgi:RNA polymerase sigma-70 factor (ECF subfamily)
LSDRERLLLLAEEIRPLLHKLAMAGLPSKLQGKIGASDIIQQTVVDIQSAATIPIMEERSASIGWIVRTLKNNLCDATRHFLRTSKRDTLRECPLESDEILDRRHSVSEQCMRIETMEELRSALCELRSPHREIINWHFIEGMTYGDIAAKVNRSEDAVRMLAVRSVEHLRRVVQKQL